MNRKQEIQLYFEFCNSNRVKNTPWVGVKIKIDGDIGVRTESNANVWVGEMSTTYGDILGFD